MKLEFRKDLSIIGLLRTIRHQFDKITDNVERRSNVSLTESLMSGLAVFGMKYASLLQFDKDQRRSGAIRHNLRTLYGVNQAPCDTYMREILDEVKVKDLKKAFKAVFATAQRGKILEEFSYIDNSYLLSVDGTGYFSSKKVHCDQCCEKHHRDGSTTYYHQMLGAALVHPDLKYVLPLAPEAISKQDGARKNDCERNAATRLLTDIRREHPHLKFTVIEDGLSSNGPHINLLRELDMHFILGAKPKDHTFLFDWIDNSNPSVHTQTDEKGYTHRFRFLNGVPLNDANFECEVNFIEYWETSPKGKTQHFTWVTDFTLTKENIYQVMKGGRARWKIENETFNTLKNQGYHFEHNFGHGKKDLASVMAHLMLLAFLVDQLQELCCKIFRQAMIASDGRTRFWRQLRSAFLLVHIQSWEDLYFALIHGHKDLVLTPNTS